MVSTSKATTTSPHLSIVIPVYKAENCLDELYLRLKAALESITTEFEIVLAEDCGGGNSWQVIERLAAADPRVRGIQFSRNFAAVQNGARGRHILTKMKRRDE
jgi:glycosyltransferase involved in cell wall biosynthesis